MSTVDEFYHLIILNFFWLENYYGFIVEKLENIDKNKVKVFFHNPIIKNKYYQLSHIYILYPFEPFLM